MSVYFLRKMLTFNVFLMSIVRLRIVKNLSPLSLTTITILLAATWIVNGLRAAAMFALKFGPLASVLTEWYTKVIIAISVYGLDMVVISTNFILMIMIFFHRFRFLKTIKRQECGEHERKLLANRVKNSYKTFCAFWSAYMVNFLFDLILAIMNLMAIIWNNDTNALSQFVSKNNVCVIQRYYCEFGNVIMSLINSVILLRTDLVWKEVNKIVAYMKEWVKGFRYVPNYYPFDGTIDNTFDCDTSQ